MAHYEDLEVDQGSNVRWRLKMLNSDGSRRDLTGYTGAGMVKKSHQDSAGEAIDLTVNFLVPRTDGIIEISLDGTQTDSMDKRRYVYDLEIEKDDDGDAIIERILEGRIIVARSVTR